MKLYINDWANISVESEREKNMADRGLSWLSRGYAANHHEPSHASFKQIGNFRMIGKAIIT